MSTAAERATQLDLVARLKSAYPELPDAPTPDLIDHDRFWAYMKTTHDVGGEPDAPMKYENKQYEKWEHMTYVICEVLAWRGIWLSEERRRIGNVDVGRPIYLGLAVLRPLAVGGRPRSGGEAPHQPRRAERPDGRGQGALCGGIEGKTLEAQPKFEGDGSQVKRNSHHIHAVGKGDPQVYAGKAGEPKFKVGDPVVVRELPVAVLHPHTGIRPGRQGEIAAVAYESPAAEDETWDRPDAKTEWFYVVRFKQAELWHGYTGGRPTPCGPRFRSAG